MATGHWPVVKNQKNPGEIYCKYQNALIKGTKWNDLSIGLFIPVIIENFIVTERTVVTETSMSSPLAPHILDQVVNKFTDLQVCCGIFSC
jgi:hypothetical protein